MAKTNQTRGKLVRKFGENIFGNPKYDRLLTVNLMAPVNMLKLEEEKYLTMVPSLRKSKK